MKRPLYFVISLFLFFALGCANKSILPFLGKDAEAVSPLKKIWVMPFPVSGENDLSSKFGAELKKKMSEGKPVLLVDRSSQAYTNLPAKLPLLPGGRINNSALSAIAEESGIQAVGVYSAVELSTEEKYFEVLNLSKTRWFLKAFFTFSFYDTETSSKLCDFYVEEKIKISKEDYDVFSKPENITEAAISELLTQASANMSEKALEALSRISWKGFVKDVNGKKIRLSSGKEVLLKTGDELDIFSPGQPFEGKDGLKYRIPGSRVGKITVSNVGDLYAEAEMPDGLNPSSDMIVKPAEIKK